MIKQRSILEPEIYDDGYYHISQDLDHPPLGIDPNEISLLLCYSHRGPGKTYGGLRYFARLNRLDPNRGIILYLRRTDDDVATICSCDDGGINMSPWAPLNRDFYDCNYRPQLLRKGLGAIYNCDDKNEPVGAPVAYVMSLSAKKAKGCDLSVCDAVFYDEFLPLPSEVIRGKQMETLMSIMMTIQRDRQIRWPDKRQLLLIMCANAENIESKILYDFELMDDVFELNASGERYRWIKDRGVLMHHITPEEFPKTSHLSTSMAKLMHGTEWEQVALGGNFVGDFSTIQNISLKGMQPLIHLIHKNENIYIYKRVRDGMFFMTDSKTSQCPINYDLNKEPEQKSFYYEDWGQLNEAFIDGRLYFKKYSYKYLILNYLKIFK